MHNRRVLALTLISVVCTGCIVPLPHIKKTCGPIQGTVVNEETKSPVQGAELNIYYPDGGHRRAFTDGAGEFRFSSKYRFHYAYVIGIALNYSLPYDLGWYGFTAITVKADGYTPARLTGRRGGLPEDVSKQSGEHQPTEGRGEPPEGPLAPAIWEGGTISLTPRAPPEALPGGVPDAASDR